MRETVSFEKVEILKATRFAFLCDVEDEEVWIPKSQIIEGGNFDRESEEGDVGELVIPEWLAIEKGLV